MSLGVKLNYKEVPSDAVILTEEEALSHQLELIRNWEKTSEVWPLRSGVSILSVAASAAGIYINGHYRRKLKLRKIGFGTTYLPIIVLPGIMSGILHKLFVTYQMLLEKVECPVCLQVRAAALQTSLGFFYPILLAPMGSFMYATRHATFRLPDALKDPLSSVRMLVKLGRPIGTQLSVIFIGQALLGSYFTYLEAKSYYTVKQRMIEVERDYENNT